MSFARSNILGWGYAEILTSAQMNALDIDHANAIDGAGGGSYTPIGQIQITNLGDMIWDGGYWPGQTSRNEWRVVSANKLFETVSGSSWAFATGRWRQQSAADEIYFAGDNMVDGAQLAGAKIWVTGAAGHGSLPSPMPKLYVVRVNMDGTTTSMGNASDTAASVGAYEATHPITVSFTPDTAINESDGVRYVLQLVGEGATNFVANLQVDSAALQWVSTTNRPGG